MRIKQVEKITRDWSKTNGINGPIQIEHKETASRISMEVSAQDLCSLPRGKNTLNDRALGNYKIGCFDGDGDVYIYWSNNISACPSYIIEIKEGLK